MQTTPRRVSFTICCMFNRDSSLQRVRCRAQRKRVQGRETALARFFFYLLNRYATKNLLLDKLRLT